MKEYVKIEAKQLEALYRLLQEKNEYIEKLELALESVKRQADNIKELNEHKT